MQNIFFFQLDLDEFFFFFYMQLYVDKVWPEYA